MNREEFLKIAKNNEYEIKEYKKGEFLYSSGWDRKIGYIMEGEVMSAKHLDERILRFPIKSLKGEFIGVNLFFFDSSNSNYFDFISNADNTKIIFFNNELFEKLIEEKWFLKMLVYDNEKIAQNTIALAVFLARGPLGYLVYLFDLEEDNGKVYFDRYLDYCDYLNINKTRLYEITKKLEQEKIIKKERKYVEILDIEKLREYYE
ncbi:MAG: hypothetical protein KAH04_07205 [Psychrilyobacter sp.]|nr:hypothetical protein [Psychrilyobacter sp.]